MDGPASLLDPGQEQNHPKDPVVYPQAASPGAQFSPFFALHGGGPSANTAQAHYRRD